MVRHGSPQATLNPRGGLASRIWDNLCVADHLEVGWPLNTRAFVGTNSTDELITSGFPVIRPKSAASATSLVLAARI